MKVKELIEQLKKVNPDKIIAIVGPKMPHPEKNDGMTYASVDTVKEVKEWDFVVSIERETE